DNLLVYYAGHGHWDKANQRGYWIPVDGGKQNPSNWISAADITDQLSVIPAKQVLVVADSCYSGVLVGSVAAQLDRVEGDKGEWLARRAQMRSRKVMSSGNVAQVMDGGAQNNSIFARQFINALTRRGEPFEAHELYREVAPQVRRAASDVGGQQEPQYGALRHAGHEAGDFIFRPKS
ncbi:MAG: caspase family protein, partial [Casimicrobium sp.]